jgi:hypothetical protein
MRAITSAAIVVAVAAGAAAAATGGPTHARTPSSNERAAHAGARHLLAEVTLPAGAVVSRSDPSLHRLLARPSESIADTELIDRHRFWRVPGTPTAVLAWVKAHRPAGSSVVGTSASSSPRGNVEGVAFSFPAVRGVLRSRLLNVAVATARGGGTAVRADAEVAWVLPRSAGERVPPDARVVSITNTHVDTRPGRPRTSAPITVTDAGKVRRIAGLVDALPLDQLGLVPCPADFGPTVDLKFYAVRGGAVLAEASAEGSGCGIVSFSLAGKAEPPLTGGPRLIHQLGKLLGVTF